MKMEAKMGPSGLKPRDANSYQKLEETRNRLSPKASGVSAALLTP